MPRSRNMSCTLIVLCALLGAGTLGAQVPTGSEQVPPLGSASHAGAGAFTARGSDASAAMVNPAAGAFEQRLTFNLSYLSMPDFGPDTGTGHAIALGVLFPTRVAVLSTSLQVLTSPFSSMPLGSNFTAGFQISKELWPDLAFGLGLDLGAGTDWKVAGDLGMRHQIGDLGPLKDFSWAVVLSDLGRSPAPAAFTPRAGVDFTLLRLKDNKAGRTPFEVSASADIAAPGCTNLSGAFALRLGFFDMVSLHSSMDMDLREIVDGTARNPLPSFALDVRIPLSGNSKKAIKALPDEGEIIITAPVRPLYGDIWALGGGLVIHAGVIDTSPPAIVIDYPEEQWISPNADGRADALVFPISITDRRYVHEWVFTIKDAEGNTVQTIRNKERRPENDGLKDFLARLADVKSGVDIPSVLRWDGVMESGEIAPDGVYSFTVSAKDDNDNSGTSPAHTFYIDNTAPSVDIGTPDDELHIFSPDGDGNKDTFSIELSGSNEELWTLSIQDAAGTVVRNFDVENGEPKTLIWDGKNNSDQIVPDGVYRFVAHSRDRALNETTAQLDNIIVNTEQPLVNILVNDPWFSPNGDGVKDLLTLYPSVPVTSGVTGWKLQILDNRDSVQKTIEGSRPVPAEIVFDGKDSAGSRLPEGSYRGRLSVEYQNGSVPTAVSPVFTLDVTAPTAQVKTAYNAFSPNGDSIQDTMIFEQTASPEWLWTGEIRRAGSSATSTPAKTFRFEGSVPEKLEWNGRTDQGALSPDGVYEYALKAMDRAGNSGTSAPVSFELSTADTPLLVTVNAEAFSPNADGVKDTVTITPQFQVVDGIESWRMAVLNASGTEVRVFEGRGAAPRPQVWDGKNARGEKQADGAHSVSMTMRYRMGNAPEAKSETFFIDTVAPSLELAAEYTVFSPNGDNSKDSLPFKIQTAGNDRWTAQIRNTANSVVRSWNWTGSAPELAWDGLDNAGNLAPDGRYSLLVESTDLAGNRTAKTLSNLVLDNSTTRVFLTSSANALAPTGNGIADSLSLVPVINNRNGIESWKLEILNEAGRPVINLADGRGKEIPNRLNWDGKDSSGSIVEGLFKARLEVVYEKGDLSTAETQAIRLDTSAPELSFVSSPEFFSPDNDGVDDELNIRISVKDASPIDNWSLEIFEPGNKSFWKVQGTGSPAERLVWDGRSNRGELVQSATDYQVVLKARDSVGNESEFKTVITVDVLVIRVGDQLRIQVPSIIFRENANDFNGLPADTVSNNDRVLRRIATILNRFREYKIVVEGHANPVTLTASEEKDFLKPLSESRAQAVMEKLIEFGVDRNRLSYIGLGGTKPVIAHRDRENWWKNRRVEFILIK